MTAQNTVDPARGGGERARKRIGSMLVTQNFITENQLREALGIQSQKGGKIVEVLISLGYLTVDGFMRFLSRQPGVPGIDLSHYQIAREITELIPKEMAVLHEIFPIDRMGKLLTLGMACPLDTKTVAEIETLTGLRVKALLCSQNDIHRAIEDYYGPDKDDIEKMLARRTTTKTGASKEVSPAYNVEASLKLTCASRLVRQLKSLPALPDTVQRVREALDDTTVSPGDVAEAISRDPALAAKVLSVANSASYGFQSRVDSINFAVALMGLKETYSIVLAASVVNLFDKTRNFDYKTYWQEAMNCAAAAKILANSCGRGKEGGVFAAGLLHDIGRIALLETVPGAYKQIPSNLTGDSLVEEELRIVGLTHTEAGYQLADIWGLPMEIAEPIRFHHQPEFAEVAPAHVAVVSLAESWTRTCTLKRSSKEEILESTKPVLDMLSIDSETASSAFDDIAALETAHFEWTTDTSTA